MRRPFALLALSLLAGCGGASSPPPPVEVATVVVPASSASAPAPIETSAPIVAPPPPPPSADPPAFALPSPAACELRSARWLGRGAVSELRFRQGGPVFARVATGAARLVLPVGVAAQGAGLELVDAGLTLRGQLDAASVGLYGTKVITFERFAAATGGSVLTWSHSTTSDVTVTLDSITGVKPAQTPLSATVACSALSLDRGRYDTSARALDPRATRLAVLRVGASIPLSVTPTGAAVAELNPRNEPDGFVRISEVSGPRSRIFWSRREAMVFGWVLSADLHKPLGEYGFGSGSGSGAGFGRSVHPMDRVVCDKEIPVIAEAGGERMIVGNVAPGTVIDRMARHGDEMEIWVRTGAVQIPNEARLVTHAALLEGCAGHPL